MATIVYLFTLQYIYLFPNYILYHQINLLKQTDLGWDKLTYIENQ